MSPLPKTAMVLAAGFGTRLRPLTLQTPKPGLPVGGVPILLFNLYLLKQAGIEKIIVNTHHQAQRLKEIFKHSKHLGLKIKWSREERILGTAGGISHALPLLGPGPALVLNGDIVTDIDLKKLLIQHQKSNARATLAVVPPDMASVTNYVEYNPQGNIRSIGGIPPTAKTDKLKQGIFSGIQIIDLNLFKGYPKDEFGCVVRKIYQPGLKGGQVFKVYCHSGSWWDLGSLQELTQMDQALWGKKAPEKIQNLWEKVREWAAPLFDNP